MTRLVYVMAASHSGSTLLSMLLNAHPDVVTAGELKAVNLGDRLRYRCSCHALLSECAFWCGVNKRMHDAGHRDFHMGDARTHFDAIPGRIAQGLLRPLVRGPVLESIRDALLSLSPAWRESGAGMIRRSVDLVHAVAAEAGVQTVVESSKVGLRLKYLARTGALDIHVVRLIRDGRAVALTYMRPDEFAEARDAGMRGGGTGENQDIRLSMAEAAHEWLRSNEEAEALLPQLRGVGITRVQYEALCADPLATVNRIFADLGLSPIDSVDSFRSTDHHVIGNGMRLDHDSRIILDDRWRQTLSLPDLTVFQRIAGALNLRYGYR